MSSDHAAYAGPVPRCGWRISSGAVVAGLLLLTACGQAATPAEAPQQQSASATPDRAPRATAPRVEAPRVEAPRLTAPGWEKSGPERSGPEKGSGRSTPRATSKAADPGAQAALQDLAAAAQRVSEKERKRSEAPRLGADISWPQCPTGLGIPERRTLGMPMPLPRATYVVVGLTNGPAFTRNPCLAQQVRWVRSRGLLLSAYAVASYPSRQQIARYRAAGPYDGAKRLGALRNAGFQQARYAIAAMRQAGMRVPAVWIDVEPVPGFDWSNDPRRNAAVVEGIVRAYSDDGYRLGVYSTPALWARVVGNLALGLPEWRAAGETSRREAVSRCADDWIIQGGPSVMGQWLERRRDHNVTCPGAARRLSRFFSG